MARFFLFAGEASGDLHGKRLIQAFHKDDSSIHFCGVGGPRMREESFDCFMEMERFQVMGFTDVLSSLPALIKQFYAVRDYILRVQPDGVILIDYPGFNLRLARALRKKNYQGKIIQYICPSVWAHGKGRIETLATYYDLLLTIYPFETPYFSHTKLKVEYIGNPLVETLQHHKYQSDWAESIGLPHDKEIIALFPGSRLGEIVRHVPQQLKIAQSLKSRHPNVRFALSCAHDDLESEMMKMVREEPLKLNDEIFIVPSRYHYELMRSATACLAKSGTVTLELALHGVPTIVHYDLSTVNYLFAKYILKLNLSHYCIVNILAGKTLFPELIGHRVSPTAIFEKLDNLLKNEELRQRIAEECSAITKQLTPPQTAVQAIERLMRC